MAIEVRRGMATTSSAKLLVRSSVAGQLSAIVNGQTFIGDTVATGEDNNDGWGVIEITGLTTERVPVTIQVDGVTVVPLTHGGSSVDITVHALPSLPVICFGSCNDNSYLWDLAGPEIIAKCAPDAFFHLGDWIYCDTINDAFGLVKPAAAGSAGNASASLANALSKDNYYTMHRIQSRNPAFRSLTDQCAFYLTGDDHERPGSDWDNSITKANGASGGGSTDWAVTQQHVDDCEAAVYEVLLALTQAQPRAGTDLMYFTQVISPHVQVWLLDNIHFNTPISVANNDPAKTRLGPTQLAWFLASLAASTATFKLVFSSKSLTGDHAVDGTENFDSFADYDVEKEAIRQAVSAETGLVWCTGDKHTGQVYNFNNAVDGFGYDYAEVQCGSLGGGTHDSTSSLLNVDGLIYKQLPTTQAGSPVAMRGYQAGCISFATDASYMEITIHSRQRRIPFRGRIYAGEKGFRRGVNKTAGIAM